MASRAGRADGDAPAVDEAGLREARAVARMAGEQGSLDIAVGGNIATAPQAVSAGEARVVRTKRLRSSMVDFLVAWQSCGWTG